MYFKEEDFQGTYGHYQTEQLKFFAAKANARLQEMLSQAPVVYTYTKYKQNPDWSLESHYKDTHKARLICIEEIKPKACEQHTPNLSETSCLGCGLLIKKVWVPLE